MHNDMDLIQEQGLQTVEPQPCLVRRPSFRRSSLLGKRRICRPGRRGDTSATRSSRRSGDVSPLDCPLSSLCQRTGYCLRGTPHGWRWM